MQLDRLLLVVALIASTALASAQERVTIGIAPRPGQVLQTHTTMEVTTGMKADADAPPTPFAMPAIGLTMTIDATTQVGAADEQGRYIAHVVVDAFSAVMTMNGQPASSPVPMPDIVGQESLFTYDRQGALVDAKLPASPQAQSFVQQMLTNISGLTAPIDIAIGETITRPMKMALPIPAMTAGSMALNGAMKITLASINAVGADRVAHLTTALTTNMNTAAGSDAAGVTMQQTGEGTMDVNVDRGFVAAMQQQGTIDTAIPLGRGGASTPTMQMHAVMTMKSTTEAR